MRKNYTVKQQPFLRLCLILIAVIAVSLAACNGDEKDKHTGHADPGKLKIDSDLSHLLKPSNEQVVSNLPVIKAGYGRKIFTEELQGVISYDTRNQNSISSRVAGRIERLYIKYNYQPVKKGQLIMEIYSPDLAAAQQELLFLSRSGNEQGMLARAKQRLMLLGMTDSGIRTLLKSGKVSYRIPVYSNTSGFLLEKSAAVPESGAAAPTGTNGGGDGMESMGAGAAEAAATPVNAVPESSPVLLREGQYVAAGQSIFTVYNSDRLVAEFSLKPALAAQVKKGQDFVFYRTADKAHSQVASIGLIQPAFRNGQNFTLARAYLNTSNVRVGELVTARIPVLFTASWWLPASSTASVGNKTLVFKKEGNVFLPKVVQTGVTIAGMVQVKDDISNWDIAANAAYLVDSESFIKMTVNIQH